MVKQTLVALLAVTALAAAPSARTMYNDAMAKERAVRTALADPDVSETVLKAVHETIATYERVVRRYPGSGYSDNALWQAGRLALDAFEKFNQTQDRDTGARLLHRLETAYPSSKLAKQVSKQLSHADADPGSGAAVVAVRDDKPSRPEPRRAADDRGTRDDRQLVTIKDIRRTVLPDAVRVVIELDGEVPFHQDKIPNPTRVYVDLSGTRAAAPLVDETLRFESDADIVRQVRIGRHPNNTTRVVLDAAGVSSYSVYPMYNPYRLVIDCVRQPGAVTARPPAPAIRADRNARAAATTGTKASAADAARVPPAPAPLPARGAGGEWLHSAPSNTPQHGVLIAEAHAPVELPAPVAPVGPSMAAPAEKPGAAPLLPSTAHSAAGGISIARQLGLGVSRIVIDAGHGGHDPGAHGKGVVESELVLDVALRLEKLLQKVPGVEVILTRRTDEFVPLPERTAIANREGADLFLSIHANASRNRNARGIETYFLNFANNVSAAATAARENAESSQAMGALPDFVKAIALNNKLDESRDFATAVQHAMLERLRPANKSLKDLGVKQAPFVVLIGAAMPSVLAEISFLTNPQEAKLLKSGAYRQRIAQALFNAIRKYQTSLKGLTTVASE